MLNQIYKERKSTVCYSTWIVKKSSFSGVESNIQRKEIDGKLYFIYVPLIRKSFFDTKSKIVDKIWVKVIYSELMYFSTRKVRLEI